MIRAVFALLAVSLPLAAAPARPPAVHHVARPAVADWTRTVTLTPDGGVRMGNPAAKVRLVEFSSFTCPHCAAFATEATGLLTDRYVRGGQVSFEMRSALRDALDVSVALAVRAVPPQHYFAAVEAIMAAQQDWFPKAGDYIGLHQDELNGANKNAAIHAMLDAIGITAILARQGVTPAALDKALASKPAGDAIQKTTNDAWNVRKISGTPGFLINDVQNEDAHSWAQIEPAIQAALKG